MSLHNKKLFYLLYSCIWVVLVYVIYQINHRYIFTEEVSKGLSVSVKFKTSEEDIFQLFYRDSITKLNERWSQRISVKGQKEYEEITFLIPDSIKLMQIRFDFGNMHKSSPVEIKRIRLEYANSGENISKDSILSYFQKNEYVTDGENGIFGRKVIGERSDPFLLSNDLRPLISSLIDKNGDNDIILNWILSVTLALCIVVGFAHNIKTKDLKIGAEHVFVCLFIAVINLPILDNLFKLDKTKIEEKRKLAQKPDLSIANLENYPTLFEEFHNDHFGFRKALTSYGGLFKSKIFRTSPNTDKVIMGKNGWLFYWNSDLQLSYLNQRPWKSEPEKFMDMLSKAKSLCIDKEVFFLATIYPNKHSVYEEEIPKRFINLKNDSSTNRTKQAFELFDEVNISNLGHLDTLLKAKAINQLYYKHDTHWNSNGAFIAYTRLLNRISDSVVGVKRPLKSSQFKIQEKRDFTYGDLLDFIGIDNTNGYFVESSFSYLAKDEITLSRRNNFFGQGTVVIENETLKEGKTLLIVGDSFSNELLKFIPINFKKTYFIRSVYLDSKWIKKFNPDVLLYGIVERNLENF